MPAHPHVPRPVGLAVAATVAFALASCSSSATTGAGSVGTASGTSNAAGGNAPAGASGLAYRLHRAVNGITSNHLTLAITTGGRTIHGSGDQRLSHGQTLAYTLTESLPQGGSLTIVKVGARTYAKLPTTANTAKPYVLVSPTSSDAQIRALAQSLQSSTTAAPLETTGVFVSSARSLRDLGRVTVNGVRTTRYAIVIDPSKLPADFPQKATIVSSGTTSIPLDLYVDSQDRPVRVVEHVTVGATTVDSTFSQSNFNAPVTITAPPASEVSTR